MEEKKLSIDKALSLAVKNHKEGRLHEAEVIYRKILEKEDNPDALHLLGVIAHQIGKHEDSVNYISKAIQLKSDCAIYYSNLGMAYEALGKEEESAKNFAMALKINSEHENAHLACYNLGIFFKDKGKIMESLEYFNKAVELDKNFFEARWNRSLILLLLGRFKEGWEEFEYRFKKEKPGDSRVFHKPKWDGSSLQGKRILIISEQGFGDNIQFIRYVPLVKERGGYVILECRKELKRLFENFLGVDEFVEKGSDIENIKFDFYIHLMSLPQVFNTNLDSIPNKTPYLKADAELVKKFKAKINTDNFKIGIAWAGNPHQENDKNRSTRFEKFKILKEIHGVDLFSLQKGEASKQLTGEIVSFADDITDFADTASVIESLDLIISVDTSVAHLAGAMAKPIWTLLTFTPDWRWLLDRNDSPWYPGMRLFRQTKSGDWDSVFEEVGKELKNMLDK